MYEELRILAVVPARGGSKGVPRKNIRLLAGKPLIGYTLQTAKKVDEIDALVVSTDDEEIASISSGYGVRVIHRPSELATDDATTESVLLHALDFLQKEGEVFDIILVLEPTSPLRSRDTIMRAIQISGEGSVKSLLAVRETRDNIGFLRDGYYRPILPCAPRRRQLREAFYIESSTIYAVRADYLRRTGTLVCDDWSAFVVPQSEAVDINTEEDFQYIEYLIQKKRKEKHD